MRHLYTSYAANLRLSLYMLDTSPLAILTGETRVPFPYIFWPPDLPDTWVRASQTIH